MTIKQIADYLGVSKPTVSKAIKDLNIKTQKIGNRFVVSDKEDLDRIAAAINPKKSEKEPRISKNENENIENKSENFENQNGKTESETKNNANNENSTKIILDMLQKELENKEKMIQRQQNTIDNLIKTNTALTARVTMLEDKSKEQQNTIVVPESEAKEIKPTQTTEEEKKKHWWQRLFN